MSERILLVDDEPLNLTVLEAMLAPIGYETFAYTDPQKAIRMFAESGADLILADLVMPGFGGLELLTQIRAMRAGREVPFILVTAHSDRALRLKGFEAGADEFLEKPIDSAVLRARIRTLLKLKGSHDELRRSRDALSKHNRELESLQRDQRELTEFMVHDLKNPLSVVCGNLEYVRSRVPGADQTILEALDDAQEATTRMRVLVQDLLVLSRLEHSQFLMHVESVDVSALLHRVVDAFRRTAKERNIQLSVETASAIRANVDLSLLQRVIENIMDNSLRYTPPRGRIRVSANSNERVELAVSNSGPPIPPEDRRRIFEKFARLDHTKNRGSNSGIGLYFCQRAVQAHDGEIGVVQTEEWPTTFVISLPLP